MIKFERLNRIHQEKIMAIIRVETKERAIEIAEGCLAGEVSCLEISYTNDTAGDMIHFLKETYGTRLFLGAGTVLDGYTARHAIIKGAEFIISPSFSAEVAQVCNRYHVPYLPGCMTMTEVVSAIESGCDMVKAFPTSSLIGPEVIGTIKTPLPNVAVLSSGGVTLDNVHRWLDAGVDCMGIGSLLSKGSSEEIATNAKQLRGLVNSYN